MDVNILDSRPSHSRSLTVQLHVNARGSAIRQGRSCKNLAVKRELNPPIRHLICVTSDTGEQRIMASQIRTIVIPAAGQGTRLLPSTKVTPKELMNVYDRPVLQFAIDEAASAGAERVVMIIHPTKETIRDYLARDQSYIQDLEARGKHELGRTLAELSPPKRMEIVFAYQHEALGLGHAISCAADFVLPGPVAIILPDDVIFGAGCIGEMARHYTSGHMVAAMEVAPEDTSSYGIFRLAGPSVGRTIAVSGMVEKPALGQAPSRLAAVGRYILDPVIIPTLLKTRRGAGGEIQLTDAIAHDSASVPLSAFRFSGTRYDCGTHDGLLEAANARQSMVKAARRVVA